MRPPPEKKKLPARVTAERVYNVAEDWRVTKISNTTNTRVGELLSYPQLAVLMEQGVDVTLLKSGGSR